MKILGQLERLVVNYIIRIEMLKIDAEAEYLMDNDTPLSIVCPVPVPCASSASP